MADANATLQTMTQKNVSIRPLLNRAAGYAVFPKVGEGGVIVGGAFGQGVLFERGRHTGFIKLEQASVGATLGGKSYAELLVFRDPSDLADVKDGEFQLTADADVVVLTAGAATTASLQSGVTAFVMPIGGLMVDASVAGQRLKYVPAG